MVLRRHPIPCPRTYQRPSRRTATQGSRRPDLSESFETNPAVDVSFTDAVTGARQIEMLGLAGPYVQITRENLPDVRGLAAIYGLAYLPGPWVESIQLAKGPGSVTNGEQKQ